MRFLVIVARYKESLDWMSELRAQSLVFNKNREDDRLFDFNLPNRGRETDTFLRYIVENYHDLPEYMAFLQGNPLDHCPSCVGILNEFAFGSDFKALGKTYYRDNDQILAETLNWAKFCDLEVKSPPKFISGMQCIVSKKRILARTKESYENLHSKVSKEIDFNSHTGYYFEYLWPTILGFNEELEVGSGDC